MCKSNRNQAKHKGADKPKPTKKKEPGGDNIWKRGCLKHPGCVWSCPCDCKNCIAFEAALGISIQGKKE